jgi:hypothetical protein
MKGSMIDGIYIPDGRAVGAPMTTASVKAFRWMPSDYRHMAQAGLHCHQPNGGNVIFSQGK